MALAVALPLAGCADGKADASQQSATTTAAPATVSADTGSIAGTIVDDEQSPVVNAIVGLIDQPDREATTDGAGKFTFNDLAPGDYKVAAQKLGYDSISRQVTVTAGEVAEVVFVMNVLQIEETYHDTIIYDGFFSCGASSPVLTVACRTTVDGQDKTSFSTNVSEGVMTFIDAMTWQSSAPGTAKILRNVVSVASPGSGSGNTNGVSPNIVRLDEPKTKDKTKVNHVVWIGWTSTSDPTQVVVVVYQQKFNIVTSVFYGEEAPEDYTGLVE